MHSVVPSTFLVNDQYANVVAMRERNKKIIVLLILGLIVQQQPVSSQVIKLLEAGWNLFEKLDAIHNTYLKFTTPSTADLMEETVKIVESIDRLENAIEQVQQSIDMLLYRLPLLGKISSDIQLLNSHTGRIDVLYGDLLYYLENPEDLEGDILVELLKPFSSYSIDSVAGTVRQMYTLLVPRKLGSFKESLFVLLAMEVQSLELRECTPPQKRLFELFDIIIDTEMRASVMLGFGNMMKAYMDNRYLSVLKDGINLLPTTFRTCDPPQGWERGVTFHEFERFLQIFMVQEDGLNRHNKCKKKCTHWNLPSYHYIGCDGFECSASPTRCYGRLASCTDIPSTTICEYRPLQKRRYSWFEHGGVVYGPRKDDCPDGVFHYPGPLFGVCSLCRCICSEDGAGSPSTHFISLREQLTNIDDNMVVIGLGFVIINRIAHIRVMQGKLGSRATILGNSTSWIEPEDIYYVGERMRFFKRSEGSADEELVEDTDAVSMTWEKRRINLDSLSLPKDYVLTGVRFRKKWQQNPVAIELELRGTLLDFETFQLKTDSNIWVAPDSDKERVEYQGGEVDNPIKSTITAIDSKPYHFINFNITSIEKDAGQTTIPFLDGVPVLSEPYSALTGVGLYHKSQPGYGGFLTLVLEGLNQALYLPTEL